VRGQLQ